MKKEKKVPVATEAMIGDLKEGLKSRFWVTIKKILENEKHDIKDDIFQKEALQLTDKDIDDLIKWHNFLEYVVKLPEMCIESLESPPVKDGTEEENNHGDPYENLPIQDVRRKITS